MKANKFKGNKNALKITFGGRKEGRRDERGEEGRKEMTRTHSLIGIKYNEHTKKKKLNC